MAWFLCLNSVMFDHGLGSFLLKCYMPCMNGICDMLGINMFWHEIIVYGLWLVLLKIKSWHIYVCGWWMCLDYGLFMCLCIQLGDKI